MNRHAVTGALLFDGTTDPPRPEHTVVWEGNRISWVGPDAEAPLDGTVVVEAKGDALLPGLIDAHVHLCLEPTIDGVDGVAEDPIERVMARSIDNAARLLAAGITTARDQGSRDGVAVRVAGAQRNGEIVAARIMAAGRGITPTGGHGWMLGVEADGPEAVRAAVAAEVARGAEIIKLFPTGGVLGSGSHGFDVVMTAAELEAAVEEAHRLGVLVGAHIHGPEGIEMALEAGIDTIEHATGITAAQARRAAAQGVALVPTLTGIDVLQDRADLLPPDLLVRALAVGAAQAEGIRIAIAEGARVLAGTDSGTPFNPPGLLPREMRLLAGLGMGNAGAIAAATSLVADTLRMQDRGVVRVGAIADLLLVDGDPLADLTALERPRMVVQDGAAR
ncbi:MAG: amidohydrolase family protein [Actinobacteria bacterium]|nr:amidohydrolase family protein [Actinomycetota bacterium]MBU1492652.1 amidohydrolase family protein [Actinomycetota bacterium]MBU1864810.1 amidohydrolase family protein [Actinomycetota bacterium]